ncbi:hypothetical protein [Paenibacillus piri]|uniref:DUF2238 domain-containing protein n=1 Tax=Paenibacillus piri TaxID=2547395 RepID=A0A4R5KI33_9BACL|nr:hypothetical protein [Paenibacillus piri]TDF95103.1 hypothetical protein E1757_21445 [Paenibacillus piri]
MNHYFELALYALAAVCFVYFLIRGIYAKVFEAVLIVAVLALIRAVIKFTKVELFPALRFSILLFIFVAMFLANEFGFYTIFPQLDKIEHLCSGVILCFVGLLIFRQINKNKEAVKLHASTAVWFSLFFAVAMAGCWEIYEYTTDQLFGLHSQNDSLVDTMWDIICGTVGAGATGLYLSFKAKNQILT